MLSVTAIKYEVGKQKKLVNQLHCVSCTLHKSVTDVSLPPSDSARVIYSLLLAMYFLLYLLFCHLSEASQ